MKKIYLCQNSFEGILSGVSKAWTQQKDWKNAELQLDGQERNMELFCTYEKVEEEEESANQVLKIVYKRTSKEVCHLAWKESCSRNPDRADVIYRFLSQGISCGRGIVHMLQNPDVYRIFHDCRHIDNEAHLLTGFIRFSERDGGLLVSVSGPENDVLLLLAPFFADRLPEENWVIYDEKRKKAAVHPAGGTWFLASDVWEQWEESLKKTKRQESYEDLWKIFHQSIAIRERENPDCQRSHLPFRYRSYMTEF